MPLFAELAARPTLRDVAEAVRESGLAGLPDAQRRADAATYQEVHVKSALSHTPSMYFDWALNSYRGCTHACEYCYARKYQRHLELNAGDDFSSVIFAKVNLPEVLARELARPGWAREVVAVGTATDPYQPIEGHYRITRRCLEALAHAATPISLITKGPMVVRDIDVLRQIAAVARCSVHMSIPSIDVAACERLEPGAAPPLQRLRAVRELADAGIDAGVLMMPLVPGITTSRRLVDRTLCAIRDAGAKFVGVNVARLDPGVRQHFLAFLERDFPHLVEGYARLYRGANPDKGYVREIQSMVKALAARYAV
jgi:DNA repair photolyase